MRRAIATGNGWGRRAVRAAGVLGLLLVAGALVLAQGPGGTVVVDNFDDGDAAGWEQNDFTGVGVFFVHQGRYVLHMTDPLPVTDPSVGTLDADWEASKDNPRFANGTVSAVVRANTYGTTVGLLMRENHETETDYGFYGSTSFGTFYIERFDLFDPDGPQTIIAMADPDNFPFVSGVDYHLKATVIGDKLELKAWKVGDPEPDQPILSITDKTFGPKAGSGIATIAFFDPVPLALAGVTEVQVSATVDDIIFTPGRGR